MSLHLEVPKPTHTSTPFQASYAVSLRNWAAETRAEDYYRTFDFDRFWN